jgi:hypothetical protein
MYFLNTAYTKHSELSFPPRREVLNETATKNETNKCFLSRQNGKGHSLETFTLYMSITLRSQLEGHPASSDGTA